MPPVERDANRHDFAIFAHNRNMRLVIANRRATRLARDLTERTAERDALAADVERLIREAGAVRLEERQRAKAEHESLADEGRQRDANRIERLEGEIARLRVIVDDADRAKAEHEKTRDELRRLHDVLSGAKKL